MAVVCVAGSPRPRRRLDLAERYLADVAGVVVVALGVVPRPVEHPQHLHAVLVTATVVRLVVVPVGVAERVVVGHPAPVSLGIFVGRSSPEIAVTGICQVTVKSLLIIWSLCSIRGVEPGE